MSTRRSSLGDTGPAPLGAVSVRDALGTALRAQILSGALAPGTKLIEEEVARTYDVARPTARQVIHDLVFEGLLRRRPNRSAEVPILMAEDILEIYAIRELIETEAIRLLAENRLVPEQMLGAVRSLESLSNAEELAASDEEWASVVEDDQSFHAALVNTLSNNRLTRMYTSVQGENRLCLAQERYSYASVGQVAREHRQLIDAIPAGSPDRAVELLRKHLQEACARLVALADQPADSLPESIPDLQG
jgi:DNA-binding GntR family transcriptional regulator